MVDGQFHLDWPSHWPLNDPLVEEWPDDPDPEWEAAETEYEGVALANASDSVTEGGEILIISNNDGNEADVSLDNEKIVSEAPSTEVQDGSDV